MRGNSRSRVGSGTGLRLSEGGSPVVIPPRLPAPPTPRLLPNRNQDIQESKIKFLVPGPAILRAPRFTEVGTGLIFDGPYPSPRVRRPAHHQTLRGTIRSLGLKGKQEERGTIFFLPRKQFSPVIKGLCQNFEKLRTLVRDAVIIIDAWLYRYWRYQFGV